MSDLWRCPGCGSLSDDPRDHVNDCDFVDGAGNPITEFEYTLTVVAERPPEVDVTVTMNYPMPKDATDRVAWFAERAEKIVEALDEKAEDMDMEGYLAEYIVTEGGAWTIKGES